MTAQTPHPSIQPNVYPSPPLPATAPMPVAFGQYEDDWDLGQILQILRRRWLMIGGVTLIVSGTIWTWALTRTPLFQGEFRVLIASIDDVNPSNSLLQDAPGAPASVDFETQIEVLKSPVLLDPIARTLAIDYPDITASTLLQFLQINRLRDTKVLAVSYSHSDSQRIQAVLEEVSRQYLDYSFEQRQASLQQGIQFVDDQLPEVRDRVQTLQVQLERFRQQYSILDPEIRGNEISELLATVEEQRQDLQAELAQAQSLYQTLQGQLKTSPEQALTDAALSESSRYQALLDQIQELEAEIAVAKSRYQPDSPQVAALEDRRDNLQPLLEAESGRILGNRFNGSGESVSGYLTPTALELNRELITAANNVQMLQARNRTLARIESDIKEEFDLVPELARRYNDLQRDLAIATKSLNRFQTTRETLQIEAAQNSIPWQMIKPPVLPTNPISPNLPRHLTLGAIAGLLVGITAALLTEKLDQVFHSPDDLKTAVPFPLLGIVPYLPEMQKQMAQLQQVVAVRNGASFAGLSGRHVTDELSGYPKSNNENNGMVETAQTAMFLEAFRSLYTNVKFLGTDSPIHSIVVSSSVPGEGKTTSALYLARAAAVMGQRVLLVDADLRAPKHHNYLNLTNIRGLSTIITDGIDLAVEEVIQESFIEQNLSVLTAGPQPPDPVKLLSSQRMKTLITDLEQQYDLVVYDMPPLIGFADSPLLAAHTDGMIVIVGLGKTERAALNRALDDLKISPVSVLGVVANGIKAYTTPVPSNSHYQRYYGNRAPRRQSSTTRSAQLYGEGGMDHTASPIGIESDRIAFSEEETDPNSSHSHTPATSTTPYPQPSSRPPQADVEPTQFELDAPGNGAVDSDNVASRHASFSNDVGVGDVDNNMPPLYNNDATKYELDDDVESESLPPVATVGRRILSLNTGSLWQWAIAGVTIVGISSVAGWLIYHRIIQSDSISPDSDLAPIEMPSQQSSLTPTTSNGSGNSDSSSGFDSVDSSDPFTEAIRLAQSAGELTNRATSSQDWAEIAKVWKAAAAQMADVPQSDTRFQQARDRVATYSENGDYARQRVLLLQVESSTQ